MGFFISKTEETTVVSTYTNSLGEKLFTKISNLAANLLKYFEQPQLVHGPQSGNYWSIIRIFSKMWGKGQFIDVCFHCHPKIYRRKLTTKCF